MSSKEEDFQALFDATMASSKQLTKLSSLRKDLARKKSAKTADSSDSSPEFSGESSVDVKDSAVSLPPADESVAVKDTDSIESVVDSLNGGDSSSQQPQAAAVDVGTAFQADSSSDQRDLAEKRFDRYFEVNEISFSKFINVSSYIINDISIMVRMSGKCSIQVFFDNFVKDWLYTNQEFVSSLGLSDFVTVRDEYKIYPRKVHIDYDVNILKKRSFEWKGKVNTAVRVSAELFDKLRMLCTFTKIPVVYYLQLAFDEFLVKNRKILEKQKYFSLLSCNA